MKRTGMKAGLIILTLALIFAALPVSAASAGFVPDEEPVTILSTNAMPNRTLALQTSQASFPYAVKGGYVVYPGVAWNLRFLLPKDTCFRVQGEGYMTHDGEPCIP